MKKVIFILLLMIPVISNCQNSKRIPVIHCSDLYHPHGDPDDHFDLACLFSIKEFDIKAVIIDNAANTKEDKHKPGFIPIQQMNSITGRNVPYAVGLKGNLKSIKDDGSDQTAYQDGVNLILKTLKESSEKVNIIAVGSMRDVAAAINRNPDLARKKIDKIFVFAGDGSETNPKKFTEWNVSLDTLAFSSLMNSGLSIYWIPCFDGGLWQNKGKASYINVPRTELLNKTSQKVMNYFLFCFLKKQDSNFIEALDKPIDAKEKETILKEQEDGYRALWSCHVFPYIAGRNYIKKGNEFLAVPKNNNTNSESIIKPFVFKEIYATTDMRGMVFADGQNKGRKIMRFEITDRKEFAKIMTSVVSNLLGDIK